MADVCTDTDQMKEDDVPKRFVWKVKSKKSGNVQRKARDFSPLTRREKGLYGPEWYSDFIPVKPHSHYRTYPPGYFKWRHKYRLQEQQKEES